jgi:putative protein kinase ArgK-like GTPase of G3E family
MKAGLLEIAHIFVVNKADREGCDAHEDRAADHAATPTESGLGRSGTSSRRPTKTGASTSSWRPSRLTASHRATHTDGRVGEAHREREFLDVLDGELRARLERRIDDEAAGVLARVRRGEVDPYTATRELLGDRDALRRLLGES